MSTDKIYARVSKDGKRVLCGSKQNGFYWCGEKPLGILHEWRADVMEPYQLSEPALERAGFEVANHQVHTRFIEFPVGWSDQDGVWGLSDRARRQLARGYQPTYRQHREILASLGIPKFLTPTTYPCRVRCPNKGCGVVQVLDRRRLNVVAYPADLALPLQAYPTQLLADSVATPILCLDMLRETTLQWVFEQSGHALRDRESVQTFRDALVIVAVGLTREIPERARYWQKYASWISMLPEPDCRRLAQQVDKKLLLSDHYERQLPARVKAADSMGDRLATEYEPEGDNSVAGHGVDC